MADLGAASHDGICDEDLEAHMYAMVHYSTDSATDVTVSNIIGTNSTPEHNIVEDGHKVKENNTSRYWKRDVLPTQSKNTIYSKVNVRKDDNDIRKEEEHNISKTNTKDIANSTPTNTVIKVDTKEKTQINPVFQLPIMENAIITIELCKNDNKHIVALESSDDDDVIEVELPPKPTICIESSDDEELQSVPAVSSPAEIPLNVTADDKTSSKSVSEKSKTKPTESCSSPVPSVVSSVSDDFIRGDCAALNISSCSQECYNFNFNLHGTDLLDETRNNSLTSKNKKKKNKQKQKEKQTSSIVTPNSNIPVHTPQAHSTPQLVSSTSKECFVTPKSKAACKRKDKTKANIPHSLVKGPEKLLNVREDQPIITKQVHEQTSSPLNDQCSTEDVTLDSSTTIDLTDSIEDGPCLNDLVIANVVGQTRPRMSNENNRSNLIDEFKNKRKIYKPPVLNLGIDFEFHPYGNKETNTCNNAARVYSIQRCVNDMDKFYNMSWGGEEFDHVKILKTMPRDKGLWHIDPSDRYHNNNRRRNTCHICNKFGHRDDRCPRKRPTCYMCGMVGHFETRCPCKICLNCGNKNHLFTSTCRNCASWHKFRCNICSNYGHPSNRCPDQWRRYHLTVDNINELTYGRVPQQKSRNNLHCSGCSQRGHILNHCRNIMPFNSYSPAIPFIAKYTGYTQYLQFQVKTIPPLFPNLNVTSPRIDKRKWDGFTTSTPPPNVKHQANVTPLLPNQNVTSPRIDKRKCDGFITSTPPPNAKHQANVTPSSVKHQNVNIPSKKVEDNAKSKVENNPETRSISPNNAKNQKKSYVLQDDEVSNTDNAVITAKILLTKDYSKKLSTPAGQEFLRSEAVKHKIEYNIENSNIGDELNIKGTGENHVEFQTVVREWLEIPKPAVGETEATFDNIPKKGPHIVVKLKKALQYLRLDIGDPKEIYKEYTYLQKTRKQIIKAKNVGQKKLKNIRNKFNATVKNLNMILLGQAGLAEGSMHLNELYTLRDILQGCSGKVSPDMRAKVAKHYNAIFSAVHRTDYDILISKYYESRHENSKRLQIYTPSNAAVAQTPGITNSKPKTVTPVPNVGSGECEQRIHVLLSRLSRQCIALQGAVLKNSESIQRRNYFVNQLKKFEYPAKRYGLTLAKKRQLTELLMEIDNALPLLK